MSTGSTPDGAFVERAHDAAEVADSADLFHVYKNAEGLLIQLAEENADTALFPKARLLTLISEHLDRGGRVQVEVAQ